MLFTQEELGPAPGDMLGEDSGDSFRLIIPAVEPAGGVERDRDQYRPGKMAAEDVIRKGRVGEVVGQERAMFVLDTMDDMPGGPAGTEGADRSGEGRLEVEAVRAGPVAFEDAFEGVAAGQAAGVMDAGE